MIKVLFGDHATRMSDLKKEQYDHIFYEVGMYDEEFYLPVLAKLCKNGKDGMHMVSAWIDSIGDHVSMLENVKDQKVLYVNSNHKIVVCSAGIAEMKDFTFLSGFEKVNIQEMLDECLSPGVWKNVVKLNDKGDQALVRMYAVK